MAFTKLSRQQLREEIEKMIFNLDYAPGTRLPQLEISENFGVSQGMVREVFHELQSTGLVEIRHKQGTFVNRISAESLLEAYEIREVIEGLAARLCCKRTSREDINELKNIAGKLNESVVEGSAEEHAVLDRKFHRRIVEMSGNEMLKQLTKTYQILGKVVLVHFNEKPTPDDHSELVQLIAENKPDEAERAMRDNVRNGKKQLSNKISSGTFQLHWIKE